MSDDFDSGDDLFDNVDVDDIVKGKSASATKRKSANGDTSSSASKRQKKTTTTATTGSLTGATDETDDDALDESNVKLAQRILQEKFGHDDFRHEQKGAIRRILAGKNSLVVFPTGAGKSLCYQVSIFFLSESREPHPNALIWLLNSTQIPAVAFPELDKSHGLREPGQSGVTIIISPLIALMKDQVDALKRRGISADCIDSTKSWDELQAINQQLGRGELRMIYCSPERLNNERFVEHMKHVPGGVRLVAVDEAHCISEVIPSCHAIATHNVTDMVSVGPFLPTRVSQRFDLCYYYSSSAPFYHINLLILTCLGLQSPVSSKKSRQSASSV